MTSLSEYLEGIVKVPLSLLTSEGFAECPLRFSGRATVSDFDAFLSNQTITGIVNSETLEEMLHAIGISKARLRRTLEPHQDPCLNHTTTIHCLLGPACLESAVNALGPEFECTVRVFCIRPASESYSDGEIYQQVSRHQEAGRLHLAEQWLAKLPAGKQKHLIALLRRQQIKEGLDNVLSFPGLWDEFYLGNWAKHLAAHCDELVRNYWNHINFVWSEIFQGLDHVKHLADAQTVRYIRNKAPAWSILDQTELEEGFENGTLFPNIQGERERARLRGNTLSLHCVIPSIQTFDENMRYLTIAAKILERRIEVKPRRRKEKDSSVLSTAKSAPENLFNNLSRDWSGHRRICEVAEGLFSEVQGPPSPEFAFVQLVLLVWRKFPRLSSESPLQDVKGVGITASLDEEEEVRLCKTALILGYSNAKIVARAELEARNRGKKNKTKKIKTSTWRGGKPGLRTWRLLHKRAFYPQLLRHFEPMQNPEPTCIQADIIRAFFGHDFLNLNPIESTVDDPNNPKTPFGYEVIHDLSQRHSRAHGSQSPRSIGKRSKSHSRHHPPTGDFHETSASNETQQSTLANQRPPDATFEEPSAAVNETRRRTKAKRKKRRKEALRERRGPGGSPVPIRASGPESPGLLARQPFISVEDNDNQLQHDIEMVEPVVEELPTRGVQRYSPEVPLNTNTDVTSGQALNHLLSIPSPTSEHEAVLYQLPGHLDYISMLPLSRRSDPEPPTNSGIGISSQDQALFAMDYILPSREDHRSEPELPNNDGSDLGSQQLVRYISSSSPSSPIMTSHSDQAIVTSDRASPSRRSVPNPITSFPLSTVGSARSLDGITVEDVLPTSFRASDHDLASFPERSHPSSRTPPRLLPVDHDSFIETAYEYPRLRSGSLSPHRSRASTPPRPSRRSRSPHPARRSRSPHPSRRSRSPHPARRSRSPHPSRRSGSPFPSRTSGPPLSRQSTFNTLASSPKRRLSNGKSHWEIDLFDSYQSPKKRKIDLNFDMNTEFQSPTSFTSGRPDVTVQDDLRLPDRPASVRSTPESP